MAVVTNDFTLRSKWTHLMLFLADLICLNLNKWDIFVSSSNCLYFALKFELDWGKWAWRNKCKRIEARTCNKLSWTEIGTFTSKLAILSQHMRSQLRLEPCSKFVDKTPSSPSIKTQTHAHTNLVLVSPHSWKDKRQLFLTLLVIQALDQSHWAAQCLEGPFLPCCAEMKLPWPAWQGN